MKTTWIQEAKKNRPQLAQNHSTEIAIIGGGISGLLCAYELLKAGKEVALFEQKKVGCGATMHTTGFLTHIQDVSLNKLGKMYGSQNTKLILESHQKAIDRFDEIVTSEKIDCEFIRCPSFYYGTSKQQFKNIQQEFGSAQRYGYSLPFKNFGHMEMPNQAKFHPIKFLYSLAEVIEKLGGRIYEHTEITEIQDAAPVILKSKSGHSIEAEKIILATYQPFNNPRQVFAKKGMYTSYIIHCQIKSGILQEAIYQDNSNPYYYFRIDAQQDHDRLILGGADHRAEIPMNPEKNHQVLENYLQTKLEINEYKVVQKWHGPILEPSDGIALIGAYKKNRYLATAFSGTGLTYAGISGMLIKDLILGEKNPWEALYNPKRPRHPKRWFHMGIKYTEELIGGAVRNYFKKP